MVSDASDGSWERDQIGHYRLIRQLGRGGMGEVMLAEDPRLGRRVAIKRLHTASATTEAGRARLLREARLLARLRHPAIVQIYELLTIDGKDHVVMEHVDGPDLRQVLESYGPLPPDEILGIGQRLAAGLAHAHRMGVVHRDLKTENVLIDANGEPRIADFGLARSEGLDTESDQRLTAEGRVVGTVRVMAPEQLADEPVDARTDLFALGVLLAELLTGTSPFAASSRQATIQRVLTEAPTGLSQSGASHPLVELIEQLLEKEPDLRPRDAKEVEDRLTSMKAQLEATENSAGFVSLLTEQKSLVTGPGRWRPRWQARGLPLAAAFAVLAALLVSMVSSRQSAPESVEPLYIAVLPTEASGLEASEADLLTFAIRSAAQRALSHFELVVGLGTAEVDAVADQNTPQQVARAIAADQVLTSRVACTAAECWLELARLEGDTGTVVWSEPLQAPRAEPQTLAWATEQSVAAGLDQPRLDGSSLMPPELVEETLRLRFPDRFGEATLAPESTFEYLTALAHRKGNHVELELWKIRLASRALASTRDPVWLERGRQAQGKAAVLATDDLRVLLAGFDLELAAGHLEAAATTLDLVERQRPGDLRLDDRRAQLWMAQGRTGPAIQLLQRAVARRPAWKRLFNLARYAADAGELELAFEALERLESRAPGSLFGRQLRATLEFKFGDLDRAAELYESLATGTSDLAALSNLGVAHLLRRDADAALEALQRARELAPENPAVLLNLADAYSLAGHEPTAKALYAQVEEQLAGVPATGLQELTSRAQARARLGRAEDAVGDIEAAIRRAPENPAVRFEAALVYAIVGDKVSAERNRRRSLELGFNERWFSLAAFDVLP